jgi:hypothetical protein
VIPPRAPQRSAERHGALCHNHDGVTLHQHPPSAEAYAAVMTWVALVKGHVAAEPQALESWIDAWTHGPDVQALAQPQIAADPFLQGPTGEKPRYDLTGYTRHKHRLFCTLSAQSDRFASVHLRVPAPPSLKAKRVYHAPLSAVGRAVPECPA